MLYSIAIDGLAASGKSTAAKGVAKKLGFLYIDTGAMYRAFTLHMLNLELDTKSEEDALIALKTFDVKEDTENRVFLNGVDVTKRIREMDISYHVSFSCAHFSVRKRCVEIQQELAKGNNVVMDGRDIGTVVLPNATLKVFQVASIEARAQRRQKENEEKGIKSTLDEIKADIERRDYIDSHRKNSPLKRAKGSLLLDTSNLTIEEEIDAVINMFYKKIGKK